MLEESGRPHIVVFSAKNRVQLEAMLRQIFDYTEAQEDLCLRRLAYSLQLTRETMECRAAFVVRTRDELLTALKNCIGKFCGLMEAETPVPIFVGDAKEGRSIPGTEKENESIIRLLLADQSWEKIAWLWTQGARIPWELFYQGEQVRKLSLPTYPFAKERYSINAGAETEAIEQQENSTAKENTLSLDVPVGLLH